MLLESSLRARIATISLLLCIVFFPSHSPLDWIFDFSSCTIHETTSQYLQSLATIMLLLESKMVHSEMPSESFGRVTERSWNCSRDQASDTRATKIANMLSTEK